MMGNVESRQGLADRVALVTGAGGGIGLATCAALAAQGARIIAADRDAASAQRAAEHVSGRAGQASAIAADLAEDDQIHRMVQTAFQAFGRLDILVNNAADLAPDALAGDRDVETMDVAIWDRVFRVNTRGTMLVCKYALPHLAQTGRGAIVNVASNLALQGQVIQAAYAASKAAVLQMTRSIAASHGRRGIRCNAVSPGLTVSPSARAHLPPALLDAVSEETLTPYLGEPEDIAAAIVFAASDAARYMNGHNLVVDGGTVSHVPGFARFSSLFAPEVASP
jgi:NAD(P)-dependent dehydrogenase (short-subunit alcohol dehydrogenase family)